MVVLAGKKQLPSVRIAEVDDVPAPPPTLSQAFERGSRLDELRAMYRIIAAHIESVNTLARDLAALTRQAREISKEIESLEARESDDTREAGSTYGATDAEWRPQAI